MDRLRLLTSAAYRTRKVNEAFGTQLGPREIEQQLADEDVDLIVLWREHTDASR